MTDYKNVVAVVKRFGGDLGDAFHRPRDAVAQGIVFVKRLHEPVINGVVRLVLRHADFLSDDTLFLLYALLGKIRDGDEAEENLQILMEFSMLSK